MLDNFYIRIRHWEFWPTWLIYFPVVIQYIFHAILSRSLFYYSATNPNMETGGLFGASKYKQLNQLHPSLIPKTCLITFPCSQAIIEGQIQKKDMQFPFIVKPDKAERGVGIKLINNREEMVHYTKVVKYDFLIQEYINYAFEAGVFFYKIPGEQKGIITSIVLKDLLKVKGDGILTIEMLMKKSYRARMAMKKQKKIQRIDFNKILNKEEVVLLEPIGNHNRGTMFLNGNHLINDELEERFNEIGAQLPGFYYGRFDLRAPSSEDFAKGQGIKILEVNGVNAEPAHIYDPSASLLEGITTLLNYWKIVFKISKLNIKSGVKPICFKEALQHYKNWKMIKS